MIDNMFYFADINSIGGVETFFYNLAKKYADHDIVIYYKKGDRFQLKRLSDYVRVVKYAGERIECKRAFFNYTLDIIDFVDAEEYIQIIHADYKSMGGVFKLNPKIDRYIGVSKVACDAFKEITGADIELIYNPYVLEKPHKVLNLISATRLTYEKGRKRIEELGKILDRNGIPYIWTVFTNDQSPIKGNNIIIMPAKLDILDYINNADYLVQLSDSEAYCYSVVEALSIGVPVIVTDCPVFKEIGVVDGENGFVLDFDLKNVPVEKIYKGLKPIHYDPIEDTWNDILVPGKSKYDEELKIMIRVRAKIDYFDLVLQRIVQKEEILLMPKPRVEQLLDLKFIELIK